MRGESIGDHWPQLPLFPLNTVLFPGMVLPLHIYEERYKLMIERCLAEDRPFGVVLIRDGQEAGGEARPFDVGTTAVIVDVDPLQDGRMNIVTLGSERFRLHSVQYEQPYLVGHAEPWPLTNGLTADARKQVAPVRALFDLYLSLLVQAQGHKIEIDQVTTEPRILALLIAISLQVPMLQKQRLLSHPTIASMLRAEWGILRREQLLLNYIIQTQQSQWEGGSSGYLAKN